ncbi:hypothetical protein, partial [Sinorhizobium meliloti]|uniref:hypothetical protein n=1 Tax=Rhizobium meliloti TaxID=382 RepID=UPI001AED0C73
PLKLPFPPGCSGVSGTGEHQIASGFSTQRRRLKISSNTENPYEIRARLVNHAPSRLLRVARCCTVLVYQVSFQTAESLVIPALTHSD